MNIVPKRRFIKRTKIIMLNIEEKFRRMNQGNIIFKIQMPLIEVIIMSSPIEMYDRVLKRLKEKLLWLKIENEDHAAIWSIEFYLTCGKDGTRAEKDRIFREAAFSLETKEMDKFWNYASDLVHKWMEEEYVRDGIENSETETPSEA
jgi:hypothetical protein